MTEKVELLNEVAKELTVEGRISIFNDTSALSALLDATVAKTLIPPHLYEDDSDVEAYSMDLETTNAADALDWINAEVVKMLVYKPSQTFAGAFHESNAEHYRQLFNEKIEEDVFEVQELTSDVKAELILAFKAILNNEVSENEAAIYGIVDGKIGGITGYTPEFNYSEQFAGFIGHYQTIAGLRKRGVEI
ncbi:hypothetical protein ABD91_20955 [Lysinibacillus sphaericus]|uniref:hypothetical protein n=1 Tax=Lysinibacillus sphaericus TaxID=1421 RepID=UPI0018CE2C48|nr:hypothetical protein [Lysinibacillus sphaericus]MBG9693212.1 hypothetical protein [Lysinibacillus sphaericus]